MAVAPAECKMVDHRMWECGEGWLSNDSELNLDSLKTASEIAQQFGLAIYDIQNWHKRHPDLIPVKGKWRGKNLYLVRDVVGYFSRRDRHITGS